MSYDPGEWIRVGEIERESPTTDRRRIRELLAEHGYGHVGDEHVMVSTVCLRAGTLESYLVVDVRRERLPRPGRKKGRG